MPEITVVDRSLTLKGCGLVWLAHQPAGSMSVLTIERCHDLAPGDVQIGREETFCRSSYS